jgi:hypothetical protein
VVISYILPATTYAALYTTGGDYVADSEASTTSASWVRVRIASPITLTDDTQYVVKVKISSASAIGSIANAKIILDQSDAGGIDALEMVHQYNNAVAESLSWEEEIGAYAQLSISGGGAISNSQVSSISDSYVRLRSGELTLSTNELDVELSSDDITYTEQDFDNQYDSIKWAGGTFTFFFETTLKFYSLPGPCCSFSARSSNSFDYSGF